MGHARRTFLIVSGVALVVMLGFGSAAAPASGDACSSPPDVVPNPDLQATWKYRPIGVTPCGPPVVAELAPLPTERIDSSPSASPSTPGKDAPAVTPERTVPKPTPSVAKKAKHKKVRAKRKLRAKLKQAAKASSAKRLQHARIP